MEYQINFGCNHAGSVFTRQTCDVYDSEELSLIVVGRLIIDGSVSSARDAAALSLDSATSLQKNYDRLSGEYWLVVVDHRNDKLSIVNDHLGMVPCYYGVRDGQIYFTDSLAYLKSQIEIDLAISKQAIFNYMYFHCIPSPLTIYDELYKLEPGKAVLFERDFSKSEAVLYAPKFEAVAENREKLSQECLSEIERVVKESVTESCGAFLSGGLDSSTVSGMLARHTNPAKTFSIGFNAEGYDETPYAQITSKHFNTEHQVLYLQSQEAAEAFVDVAQYFDEPFGNSSAMAAFFCAKFAKEHGVTTLLAGDGGDELFAGNERYAKQKQFELYYKLPRIARGLLNFSLNNSLVANIPGISKAASYVRQAEVTLPARLQSYNFINIVGLEEMFTAEFLSSVNADLPIEQLEKRYQESQGEHPVDNMLYLDWKFTLADNDLIKVNKMCELAGVEVKYPLLDKRVVDFSCRVPAEMKLPGYELRDFYKKTCRGFLADETLDKSKHGFGLPFGVWLKENKTLKMIALDALEKFKSRNIISPKLVDKALEAHNSIHTGYYGELIWIMVVLELWLQGHEGK